MAGPWEKYAAPAADGPWAKYAQPAVQESADPRPPGSIESAVREPLLSLGSSASAAPIAGVAGIGAAATKALGLTDADPADVVGNVQSALTYQPRTRMGQAATDAVSYPFQKLAEGADAAGQVVADSARGYVGSNAANLYGTAANVAVQSAPALLTRRGGKVARDVNPRPDPGRVAAPRSEAQPAAAAAKAPERPSGLGGVSERAPSLEQLKADAAAAYKRADEAGIVVRDNSLTGLKTRITSIAKKEGLDKDLHPDSSAVLKRIQQSKGNLTLSELETMRKVANDAKGSLKPADQRIAGKIVDEIDDYLDNLSETDVLAGTAEKAKALKDARSLYSRAKKSETIAKLMDRAETKAGAHYTQAGMEHALRGEFKALALNEKQLRRFSKAEQEAIKNIAKGGKWENSLRNLGKFDPTSGGMSAFMSTLLAGGGAASTGGASLLLPAAAYAAKRQATRITSRKVSDLDEMVRGGGQPAIAKQPKRNALADF